MSFVATRPVRSYTHRLERIDLPAVATRVLGFALVLYLALEGGGYDVVVSSQVGLLVWWVVLIGAAWAIIPAGRLSRVAWWGLGLFAAFTLWTAIASTWSLSSERSLQELSRVATYLGVALLAVAIHRDRAVALRQTAGAVGAAVTVVAIVALIARLFPGSFPSAATTGAFLNNAQPRLSWPLNYWNGLAALMAIGLPMLLSVATTARTIRGQVAGAAAIPVVALCAYLTASRAGAIAIAVALVVFLALAADRFPKLATMVATGAGSAILIAGAVHRNALQQGFSGHAATVQGKQLFVTILLVCAAVAVAQLGIALATRHGRLPGVLRIPQREARWLLAGGISVALVAALAAGVPHRLSHAWHDFKYVNGNNLGTDLGTRLTTLKGEGRYQYWKVAVNATSDRRLQGSGPGTFQDLWLPRANQAGGYVTNAHSLYVETLAESGVVGLMLLIGFMGLVVGAAILAVIRSRDGDRSAAAAAAGALLAFIVAASVDWLWELPVVPVAFLLVAAAVLAPAPAIRAVRAIDEDQPRTDPPSRRAPLALRVGLVLAAIACLAGIAVPLETASNVKQSQRAIDVGNTVAALADARTATRIEPGAASPHVQQALVLEAQHRFGAAVAQAREATQAEPQNWSPWLILSRVEAEAGHPQPSVVAFNRARSLNPLSPIFEQ